MRTRITLNTDTFRAVIVCVIIRSIAITIIIIIVIVNHMKTCTYVLHSKIYHEPTATAKLIMQDN